MNFGKMDRRVTLEMRVATKDATGSRVETWETVSELWAEYVQHRGNVAPVADAERESVNQQWRIRYRSLPTAPAYRLTYQGKVYDIKNITEEGRKSALILDSTAYQSII